MKMHAGASTVAPTRPLRPAPSLRGEVTPPSDKSIAHRALMATAIADGEATIIIRSPGQDILATLNGLRVVGADLKVVDQDGACDTVLVRVRGLGTADRIGRLSGGEVDCANSGTTMRLLCGLASTAGVRVSLTGDDSLLRRPMERVADPLRRMGVHVTTTEGRPPVRVLGSVPLRAIEHRPEVASAQVLGAICFAALAAEGTTTVRIPGPTRDHTERLLGWLGASIERRPDGHDGATLTTVHGPGALRARSLDVPGDPSSASAWLVAAALHPDASVAIRGVTLNPSRLAVVEVLLQMGAAIEMNPSPGSATAAGEPVGDLVVSGGRELRAITIRGPLTAALIDELPLLAVAMAGADGMSEVRDAAELRTKESDRIAAMARLLAGIGARVVELPDGWRIERGRPLSAAVTTQGDHRIAMAAAVAAWTGLAAEVALDDPDCVSVSYPVFWRDARTLGAMA